MKKLLLLLVATTIISCGETYEEASELMEISITDIKGEYFQMISHGAENHWDETVMKFTNENTYEHGVRYIGDYDYAFPQTSIYWKDVQGNVETYHDFNTVWHCDGQILILNYKDGSQYGVYRRSNYAFSAEDATNGKFCD